MRREAMVVSAELLADATSSTSAPLQNALVQEKVLHAVAALLWRFNTVLNADGSKFCGEDAPPGTWVVPAGIAGDRLEL